MTSFMAIINTIDVQMSTEILHRANLSVTKFAHTYRYISIAPV